MADTGKKIWDDDANETLITIPSTEWNRKNREKAKEGEEEEANNKDSSNKKCQEHDMAKVFFLILNSHIFLSLSKNKFTRN